MTLNLSKVRAANSVNESVAALVDEFGRVLNETKAVPQATRDLMTELSHNRDAIINAVQENIEQPRVQTQVEDRLPEGQSRSSEVAANQVAGSYATTGDPNRDAVSGLPKSRIREIQPGTPIAINPYSNRESKPQVLRADPQGNLHAVAEHQAQAAANDMNQFSSLPSNIGNQKVDGIHKVPVVGPNNNTDQTTFAASAGTETSSASQEYRDRIAQTQAEQNNQNSNAGDSVQSEQNHASEQNTINNQNLIPKAEPSASSTQTNNSSDSANQQKATNQ